MLDIEGNISCHSLRKTFGYLTLHLENDQERRRALRETVCRMKRDSIAHQSQSLAPTDIAGLQRLVEAKKHLEEIESGKVTLHISFD